MMDPYRAGAVWWANLNFGDGEHKKYLVLLSDIVQPGDFFVSALTTSQAKRYWRETTSACGCPACACYRIEPKQEECFPLTTWVQFDNAGQLYRSDLDSRQQNGKAGFIQMLAPDRIRAVLNCALKSRDVPKQYLVYVDRALKALNTPKAKPAAPPPPAPPLSPMATLKKRFDSHGPECRNMLKDLLAGTTNDLAGVLVEKTPHPDGFLEDATMAFEIISGHCQCPKPL